MRFLLAVLLLAGCASATAPDPAARTDARSCWRDTTLVGRDGRVTVTVRYHLAGCAP